MTEPADGLSLEMITAALRADSADVAVYARVLTESLGDALPADCVTVDRARRTMSDRRAAVIISRDRPSSAGSVMPGPADPDLRRRLCWRPCWRSSTGALAHVLLRAAAGRTGVPHPGVTARQTWPSLAHSR